MLTHIILESDQLQDLIAYETIVKEISYIDQVLKITLTGIILGVSLSTVFPKEEQDTFQIIIKEINFLKLNCSGNLQFEICKKNTARSINTEKMFFLDGRWEKIFDSSIYMEVEADIIELIFDSPVPRTLG